MTPTTQHTSALILCVLALAFSSILVVPGSLDVTVVKPFAVSMIALGIFMLWLITALRDREIWMNFSVIDVAVLLWVLVNTISLLFTSYHVPKISQFENFAAPTIFYFCMAKGASPREVNTFLKILVGISVVIALCGLPDVLSAHHSLRVASTLGNPTTVSTFVAMSLPFSIVFLIDAENTRDRIFFAVATILLLAVLLLSQTRSSWFAAFVGLSLLIASKSIWKKAFRFILPGLAILLVLGVLLPSNFVGRRISESFSGQTTLLRRIPLWGASWQAFLASPVLGNGPGAFPYFLPSFRSPDYWMYRSEDYSKHAHNIALEILSETGSLGFMSFSAMIGAWLILLWPTVKRNSLARAIVVSVGICLIDNLLNVSVFRSPVDLMLMILLGAATCTGELKTLATIRLKLASWPRVLAAPLLVLFSAILAWHVHLLDQSMRSDRATFAGMQGYFMHKEYAATRDKFIEALNYNPCQVFALLHTGIIEYERADYRSSLGFFLQLQSLSKDFPQSNLFLGLSYQSLGKTDSALYYFHRETRTSNHPRGYLAFATLYRQLGDTTHEISSLRDLILFHRPAVDSSTVPYYEYAQARLASLHASPPSR